MKILDIKIWDLVQQNNIECFNNFLLLRPNAIKTKNIIKDLIISQLNDDQHIVIYYDFSNIQSMDISFADELIFLLKLEMRAYENYQFIFILESSGMAFYDELLPTISAAQLNREKIETAKAAYNKNLYIPVLIHNNKTLEIQGDFEKKLRDIYSNSIPISGITTRVLSEELNISLTNAGTQANNLLNLGLIFKETENGPNGRFNTYYKIDPNKLIRRGTI